MELLAKRVPAFLLAVIVAWAGLGSAYPVYSQDGITDTSESAGTAGNEQLQVTETQAETPTATATSTPTPTQTTEPPPPPGMRPLVMINSYTVDQDTITPGKDFKVILKLKNEGSHNAINIVASFTPGDLIAVSTGGAMTIYQIAPGETKSMVQPFIASPALTAGSVANIVVNLTYTDQSTGDEYSAAFNLALRIASPYTGPALPTKTPTPVQVFRPQLVISSYKTDVEPLQPGTPFTLNLEVRNLGNTDAKSVTMVLGGGVNVDAAFSGTPSPGGVPGASGEFTNFAPLGSSNLLFLGDLAQGAVANAQQRLIVNTTLNPGAYSVKFSFVYVDEKANKYVDEQVITLLVYRIPQIEINFYRQPDPLFVGQPGVLPIQVVNLGRSSAVLGNLTATTDGGELSNNTTLIGPLDPGGYFPLDANVVPSKAGPLVITVAVSYTDDFNQPQTITRMLNLDVQEGGPLGPSMGPGMEGPGMAPGGNGTGLPPGSEGGLAGPETFWQKVLRFFKGLIGLDSAQATPGGPEQAPIEPTPPSKGPIVKPIPVIPKGG